MKTNDPEFANIGKKEGIEIWRINKLALEKIPESQHGTFYTGDSYIVLCTKGANEWNAHFWLGNETTPDEQAFAALKTSELDQVLGGLPTQYREVQNHESPLFLSYFKDGVKYLKGGVDSAFNQVADPYKNWKPRLFHCKGKRNARCVQVECAFDSLNLGDVFILDCGLDIYVWMPPESGRLERIKGMSQAKNIRDHERNGRPTVHILDQNWDKNQGFWQVIGGDKRKIKSAREGGADENYWRTNRQAVTLWRVSDANGKMEIKMVNASCFSYDQLDSKDAFILDSGRGGVYVWVGKECTVNERTNAMQWANSYLKKLNKPEWTQVIRVLDGAEPESFTQWASSWKGTKNKPSFQPKLFQCSDESGKLAVEEIAEFTQEDLDGDDVMILDGLSAIYVWVGANATINEKKHALTIATEYLEMDNIPRQKNATIETVYQGSESLAFKKFFKSWDDNLFKNDRRSIANMRKLMFS